MNSKAMGHALQRCMSDSDSDGEDECDGVEGRAASAVSIKSRNVYRGAAKKAMKAKWMSSYS